MAKILSLEDETLKVHIDVGKEAGKWDHDYNGFESMRHQWGLTRAQMQRKFGFETWHTMNEWWKLDDKEHKAARAQKTAIVKNIKSDVQVEGA